MPRSLSDNLSVYLQRVGRVYEKPEIKSSVEILLSIFAVTILSLLAIKPTIANVLSLQKKIEDQKVILKKADTKIGQLFTAQDALTEHASSLGLYDLAVPSGFDYNSITRRVALLALKNGLTLSRVSLPGNVLVGSGEANKTVKDKKEVLIYDTDGQMKIPVSFSAIGSQNSILSFLVELENMDRLALIGNISITKQQKTIEQSGQLAVSGEVIFYSFMVPTSNQSL